MLRLLVLAASFLLTVTLFPVALGQNLTLAGNAVYGEWLASGGAVSYENVIFVPSDNQENGVSVHWTLSSNMSMLNLAVAVAADGWVGFGFSENGGMTGSDMMIFEAANPDTVWDAHVTSERQPVKDDCQDWTYVNSVVKDGVIIVEASRKLVTGDHQDLEILDDSSLEFPVHRIISAWGDSEEISYHGMNRARGTIRWFAEGMSEAERFVKNMEPYVNKTFTIKANDYPIKPQDTEYAYVCVTGDDLRAQGLDLDNNGTTMVGIEAFVSNTHVHHFIGFASMTENNDNANCSQSDFFHLTYLWAPGEPAFAFPDNVGMPIGGETGFRSFRIEFHYDNPALEEGLVDNSGIKYYYSDEPRELNAGIMSVGDPVVALMGFPIADGTTSYKFDCPSSCTSSVLDAPVTVFREYLHMHKSGVSSYNNHFREGEMIRSTKAEYYDFDQQGGQAALQNAFELRPGDSFQTGCFYENAPGTNRTFGMGSSNEMCMSFLYYYPAKETSTGFPFFCGVGLEEFLPECTISVEGISVVDNSSEQLGNERVFGTTSGYCFDSAVQESAAFPLSSSSRSVVLLISLGMATLFQLLSP